MKTVTVHRGARDGYHVARALQEAGLLETLVTDLYWPAESSWARSVESLAPRGASAALRCRHADGLPPASVESCWMSGLGSLMAAKMAAKARWLPFSWERAATRWCDRSLGREAGRLATKRHAALLSYSYYAHSAFSHVRGDQPRILFQLHPHPASVRSILQQERELHPECASSLDKEWELALPEPDFNRLVEEVAMAQHWIVASQFTKKTLMDGGIPGDRVAVVPYGVELNAFSWKKEPYSAGRPLRLLFVGTLGQRKGIKYLVQALELLPAGSVELTVCGRAVDDLAIFRESRVPVKLFPSISSEGLLGAYRLADVFVFPSLAEGFAHVLLEAMASYLPIVSTARTAAPDLIQHGREGFIIKAGSAADLAKNIEEFLRRPERVQVMGEAARRRAEYFTWRRFRQGIAETVGEILHQQGKSSIRKTCLSG
jgi:glycosyltransferase involved in cell wall biosynthesis